MSALVRSVVTGWLAMSASFACGGTDPVDVAGPPEPPPPVEIAEVIDDVAYYPGCANEPVAIAGTTWYPVPDWGSAAVAALYDDITSVEREEPVVIQGFAPRVAEPGPGDDIGTLVVYADGYARYESDSGIVMWMTTDPVTYDWIC